MNAETVSQLFFDERHVVPRSPNAPGSEDLLPGALAAASLVGALQAACERSLRASVDPRDHVVMTRLECRRLGVVPGGAELRITGWVERIGESEVSFRVQALDAHEQVCDATIVLSTVARQQLEELLERKKGALARRAMLAAV